MFRLPVADPDLRGKGRRVLAQNARSVARKILAWEIE